MDVSFMAFSRLAFGHWEGQPLYALADLGIPQRLAQPRSCADLAAELGCPAEALERLLDCAWRRSCWFARPAATATVN